MLSAKNLSVLLDEKFLLKDINFNVKPGYITALLGNNGSGKSTILNCLAGPLDYLKELFGNYQWKQMGICELNGRTISKYTEQKLATLRAVFAQQVERNFPFMVEEFVRMGRFPYHENNALFSSIYQKNKTNSNQDDIVNRSLHLTNTKHLAKSSILDLSGGEFARVRLAQTLSQIFPNDEEMDQKKLVKISNLFESEKVEPRYLLLDEPTAALDLFHQHHLLGTLRELAKQWTMGILITTHDINLATIYADQLIWLKNGEIIAMGPTENTISSRIIEATFNYQAEIVKHKKTRNIVIPREMTIEM